MGFASSSLIIANMISSVYSTEFDIQQATNNRLYLQRYASQLSDQFATDYPPDSKGGKVLQGKINALNQQEKYFETLINNLQQKLQALRSQLDSMKQEMGERIKRTFMDPYAGGR